MKNTKQTETMRQKSYVAWYTHIMSDTEIDNC